MNGIKERLRDWVGDQSINFVDKPAGDVEITVNAVRIKETGQIVFLGELEAVLIAIDGEGRATVQINSAASVELRNAAGDVSGPTLRVEEIR